MEVTTVDSPASYDQINIVVANGVAYSLDVANGTQTGIEKIRNLISRQTFFMS